MSTAPATVKELLRAGADDSSALSAPGRPPLRYSDLRSLVADTAGALNARGIGSNDRVAMVLDNGPEAASAFIAIAGAASAAPLNPSYRTEEFQFYLTDLRPRLLVVAAGKETPALDVAARLGVPVARLEIAPDARAGAFTLGFADPAPAAAVSPARAAPPTAADEALVLHTSGTTSRPKIVPLLQRNVCASAAHVRATIQLGAGDRALNIMPLFHIHGLIAGILAPLWAGSEVFCSPGFNALKFFAWMSEAHPTWYTAVPTMHQAILSRARNNADVIKANPLRLVRSSSASLPPPVIRELEEVFSAPVIESYGMTEAAHQMASNPMPPGQRKPGSVGVAAGPEICVLDEDGSVLPPGETGEIAIRGPNVMSGYENNPKANAEAFTNGWFRTGDQGVLDGDGYLTITGRLKEIINRGGEKISPREVDDVLMEHPAVQQCLAFAVPHAKLGEDVAAIVVLREGATASEVELREFVGRRLSDFKVPRKILFRDEIPKGATGKLQRIGLAEKLGLA